MQQKKQFLSSIPSILAICLLKLKKFRRDNASLIIFCKPPKRKSKLLKIFLRFPHINRTVSDGETYISALENLRFRNGKPTFPQRET